jgi:hypothetical protein
MGDYWVRQVVACDGMKYAAGCVKLLFLPAMSGSILLISAQFGSFLPLVLEKYAFYCDLRSLRTSTQMIACERCAAAVIRTFHPVDAACCALALQVCIIIDTATGDFGLLETQTEWVVLVRSPCRHDLESIRGLLPCQVCNFKLAPATWWLTEVKCGGGQEKTAGLTFARLA